MRQVDKKLLNVDSEASFADCKNQAQEIADWASSQNGICIIMMHEPTQEQEKDLALLNNTYARVALIGGQFSLMLHVREALLKEGFLVVEAITDRISEDKLMPDGTVKKVSVFKYAGLRILQ